MKLNQFALIFAIIAITIVIYTDINTNNLKVVIKKKEQIDRNLDTAVDDGATKLAEVDDNNNIIINKEGAVSSFFMSLDSSFDILSDKDSQEKMNMYIPVVAVTEDDGYYIFYSDEYTGSDGYNYISKRWSEKFPYFYEDSDFVYSFTLGNVVTLYDKNNILGGGAEQTVYNMDYHDFSDEGKFSSFRTAKPNSILLNNGNFELLRKQTIINNLEESMAYYTSRHNKIAAQYGITYNFSLPAMSYGEWAASIDDVSVFVVFQGYPYGNQIGETYNKIATAAAKVTKRDVYYIEQKGWYLVYHKDTCPELIKNRIILKDEPYYEPLDCIKQGCYACPICNPDIGVYAPDYTP